MKKDVIDKLDIYKIKTSEELLKYYRGWTDKNKYNKDMVDWQYTAPQETVSVLKKYAFNKIARYWMQVVELGLLALNLKNMVTQILRELIFLKICWISYLQDIYKKIGKVDLNKPLKFKANRFDVIMCVGTFTYGHVKPQALNELIRITKNKGFNLFYDK